MTQINNTFERRGCGENMSWRWTEILIERDNEPQAKSCQPRVHQTS